MSLKFRPKSGMYKNYNGTCTFEPNSIRGYSYGWWRAVDKIGPFVVLNAYPYSNCTAKHLKMLAGVLKDLNTEVDFHIPFPKGINEIDPNHCYGGWRHYYSSPVIDWYEKRIETLKQTINKPKTHKAKNIERAAEIARLELELQAVQLLKQLHSAKGIQRASIIRKLRKLSEQLKPVAYLYRSAA